MDTILIPAFNEEDNLKTLYTQLDAIVSKRPKDKFQFLFIDDCSTDTTPEILHQLHERDQRVSVIRFARNCGSHAAIAAGLAHCQGECAIVMAADLQDPPELILELLKQWEQGSCKYCTKDRKSSLRCKKICYWKSG